MCQMCDRPEYQTCSLPQLAASAWGQGYFPDSTDYAWWKGPKPERPDWLLEYYPLEELLSTQPQ